MPAPLRSSFGALAHEGSVYNDVAVWRANSRNDSYFSPITTIINMDTATSSLETYYRSFNQIIDEDDEETELSFRKQCVNSLIERLQQRQKEWDSAFQAILEESICATEEYKPKPKPEPVVVQVPPRPKTPSPVAVAEKPVEPPKAVEQKKDGQQLESTLNDPYFSNDAAIKSFIKTQETLENARKSTLQMQNDVGLKSYKNTLNLFIRTQINSISNSDAQHLDTKIKQISCLFTGQRVTYQEKLIDATQHPEAQLFCMYTAAQTFVSVGTRLVNSVPAIAKSMATVINGVAKVAPSFKDLVIGHLQQQCPFMVPMQPDPSPICDKAVDNEIKLKIACGYAYDPKTQSLESEEKYLTRARSLVLIYSRLLVQDDMSAAWTWLSSFLSLEPMAVISATILQAFLQEASKEMSSTYGIQHIKLLNFIKAHYMNLLNDVTGKTGDRQSYIKLKNLLSDDAQLVAAPKMSSIFGSIRY